MTPWLVTRARLTPDRVALEVDGEAVRYAALETSTQAVAQRLRAAGLRPGDVMATLLWNGRAFVECLHAVQRCSATLLPLNARAPAAELSFLLRDAAARILVHGPGPLAETARAAVQETDVRCIAAGAGVGATLGPAAEHEPPHLATGEVRVVGHPLAILHTSGTTGRPKGALISAENFRASAAASALRLGASADDRWLACLPLFHVGGLAILARAALAGSAVVLQERFDPTSVSEALDRRGITHVSLVPTMLRRLLELRGDRPAPSTLRCVVLGGASAPEPLLARARALGYPVAPTYGLTEATSQVATLPPGALSTAGWAPPLPGVTLRIIDESGAVLPSGVPGEICVQGDTVMLGYLGLPEATARTLQGGWLHTGDVGVLDGAGWLRILDRRSDLVVSGGENVYPAEVEAVLAAHPAVREAVVVGEPDEDLGQRVVAAVVLQPAVAVETSTLMAFCRARLAGFKVPRRIEFVADLPRTSTGKIQRRAVFGSDDPHAGSGRWTAER